MKTEMGMVELEDRLTGDLLDIIRFTEAVSAKLHRVLDEAEIYQVVREEFVKSDRYTANILLLAAGGKSLKLVETSVSPSRLEVLERASGLQAKEYKIRLSRSSIFSEVVKEGRTVHANVGDIIREFLPQPLAFLITNTMGYDEKSTILTPLRKHGKVTGVLAMSCTDLCEYLLPSVENLALHISTALELAQEHAQRKRAVQTLKSYHDRLGERVEERTAELKEVNKKLLKEITERKQADEALQTEKNKLQSVVDAMEYGLTIQDRDYNIIYQNKPSERAFPGDHRGEKCYRVYGGSEKICNGCPVEKAFKDGKSHTVERRKLAPSGEVVFWENTANPIRDAKGKIVSCLEVTRNITERKQAEEALRESEEFSSSLLANAPNPVLVINQDTSVGYVNPAFEKLSGFSSKEVIGRKAPYLWWTEETLKKTSGDLRKAMSRGAVRLEELFKKKNGERFWVEITSAPLRKDGEYKYYLANWVDITERKQAEEALRESQDKYKGLADSITDIFFAFDKDLRYTYWNKASEELTGISAEDALGKHLTEIFPDNGMTKNAEKMYLKALKTQKVQHFVNEYQIGGKDYFFEISAYPSKEGLSVFTKDITERKLKEKDYHDIIHTTTDGFWMVDSKGRFLDVNDAYCALTGYSREELLNMSIPDIEAMEKPEEVARRIRRIIKTGHDRFETHHRCKDGRIVDVEISVTYAGARDGRLFVFARDITERKQAEEALQVEKNKLQSVVDAMEYSLTIQDRDYNIIYQNKPSRIASGGDHVGEKCYRAYEKRDKVGDDCPVEKAFKDGKSHTAERKTIAPSGEVVFWENTANPIRDAAGKIVSCLEIGRDITERKQAEEALRESEEKLQKMFESVTDGISVVDLKGAIIETNQRMVEMHGFASKDELLGRKASELVAPRDRERIARNMRKAIKEGAVIGVEYTLLRADGSEFAGELSTNVIRDASGKAVAHITVSRDITERKRMGEALRESEERFRSIVENSQAGIMILDSAYRLTYVNDELCRISGYSREEVVGQDFRQFLDEESKKLVTDRYLRRQRGEEVPSRYEFNIVRKDGQKMRVEISSAVIKDSAGRVKTVAQILDITERKRMEGALRESEEKYKTLTEDAPIGIYFNDFKGTFLYGNKKAEEITGYKREELLGKSFLKLKMLDPKEMGNAVKFLALNRLGKATGPDRLVLNRKDGTKSIVEIRTRITTVGGRKVVLGMVEDITERQQAEQALADEATRRRILVDQSLDGIVVLDEDARVVEANRRFAEMLGYTPEEVLKLHTWDWDKNFPPERLLEMGRAVDEKGFHLETKHHRKDGSVIDVDISINGAMCCGQKLIFCVCRDVTERKQAEEALRESQEFSSSLLESSPNPINVVNMDTSIRYVNPAFEKLTGFTFGEIAGRKAPHPWWPEGKRARILAAFKDSVEHGGRRSGTAHNFRKKNGECFWVEINSAPVIRDGKAIYLIISWLDVTQRKRAEEKEKQLQQELYLAQRLASVGELAAGVAHEINNPLTGVLGFSQRLMRKSTDEAFSRDLKIIHGEARRAAEVVQNLLTFARRRQPKKEYASINDIVQKTLELRDYALQTSNIEVVTGFAPNLSQIMVDFPQMQEVFLNIILNAEQAMNEAHGRGKLIIKTREIKDHVRVSFADDGPGIAPENLDKVFDPFFTTRGERGGTGLGLSACHGIVTEHGGRIYVRSKPGKGTTFFIELPLSPAGSDSVG